MLHIAILHDIASGILSLKECKARSALKPRYPVAGSAGAISTHDLGIAANMPTYHDDPHPGDGDDDDDEDDEDNGDEDGWR